MTRQQILRRIVLPQAMRVIIPPTGNELISMLKTTSLVVAVPLTTDLYSRSREISLALFQPIPLLICAAIWYLAITSVLMVGQYYIERHYARGSQRAASAHAAAEAAGAAARAGDAGRPGSRCGARCPGYRWVDHLRRHQPRRRGRRAVTAAAAPPWCWPRRCTSASAGWRCSRASTSGCDRGEVMCVIGPSGSGKSTFLRCINHLEQINAGRLWVDGDLVGYRQRGDKLYELRESEVAATAPRRSAWCSSTSTSSRT